MKTSLRFTAAAILLTACLVTGVLYISEYQPSKQIPSNEQMRGVLVGENGNGQLRDFPAGTDYNYIVQEFEGKIAVYTKGSTKPELIFDTYVRYLPEFDRTALAKGIPVKNYEELIALIEDYIS